MEGNWPGGGGASCPASNCRNLWLSGYRSWWSREGGGAGDLSCSRETGRNHQCDD